MTSANEPWASGQGDIDTVNRDRCVDAHKAAEFPWGAACHAAGIWTSA
jgi:hypothetical protein